MRRTYQDHDDSAEFEPMRGKRVRKAPTRDTRKRNTLRAHRGGRSA